MSKRSFLHIAIIGIDGSGKSACYEGLLDILKQNKSVAGIGDKVLISDNTKQLVIPKDILRVKVKSALGILVKMCKGKFLYEISKLTELVSRSKIQDTILKRYKPEFIITDGSPLINILGWARYYHPKHFNEQEYSKDLSYLTGVKRMSLANLFYYLRNIPEIVLINKVYSAPLRAPDIIIFLKVSPEVAMQRIISRGKDIQVHEYRDFLQMLQEAYVFVCNIIKKEFSAMVLEIDTDNLSIDGVLNKCREFINSLSEGSAKINIVATTISGSIKDWKKLDNMEDEFKHYYSDSKAYIVDSHREAFETTKNLINQGAKIIVSAGGAGTFNSVLEGSCSAGSLSEDLRLAFLRKGSADLIGKALNIPDELESAVKIICEGIKKDRVIVSDVLEIKANDIKGELKKFHMIGFGGVGVFGDIPYFTESRFIKYYKGLLGYFFGDRGPFLTGANLAMAKRYLDKIKGKRMKFKVVIDEDDLPFKDYISIIIMNGDLGKHFPIAKGIPLGSGDFQITLMEDKGLISAYKQMIHAWKGDMSDYQDKLGIQIFRTKKVKIIPDSNLPYFINVDGLLRKVSGQIEYHLFSKIKLITG